MRVECMLRMFPFGRCSGANVQQPRNPAVHAFYILTAGLNEFYPEIKRFALQLERRSNTTIARTVVAKELARIVYYILARQRPFETFKGIKVTKRHDLPRTCKPMRIAGVPTHRDLSAA